MIYLSLFWEFFKAGLFAIGGGLATLPFIYDISDRLGWFTHAEIANMVAISESTPGPIGINMSTYVGFEQAGIPGALVATLGLVAPSIIIILIVALFLRAFRDNRFVNAAFYGLRPASTALVASAGVLVLSISLIDRELFAATGSLQDLFHWKSIALAAVVWILTNPVKPTRKLHPVVFILLSAVAGAVFHFAGV